MNQKLNKEACVFWGQKIDVKINCNTYLKMNSQTRGDLRQKLKMLIKHKRNPLTNDVVPQDEDETFVFHQLNTMLKIKNAPSPKTLNQWIKLENETKVE